MRKVGPWGPLFKTEKLVAGFFMSVLPEAGGQSAVLDAQDTEQSNHRGSPPPALICRIAKAGVLAQSVFEKRSPRTQIV